MHKFTINGIEYVIDILDTKSYSLQRLEEEQAGLFALLKERENEFGFNPNIITEYPELNSFLKSPIAYISERCTSICSKEEKVIDKIVILTTYGNILEKELVSNGYAVEKINMPAGPDNTCMFSKSINTPSSSKSANTLYFEAVNELDEKIRPTYVIKLLNTDGDLCGGMSGTICEVDGVRYAYGHTFALVKDTPKTTGSYITKIAFDYLKKMGVIQINCGTQTAEHFFLKQGFQVIHHILDDLRFRKTADGKIITTNLVILEKKLVHMGSGLES